MNLFESINSIASLSTREYMLIADSFQEVALKRRQYFLKPGDRSKQLAFIVKGSMRIFTLTDKGNEYTLSFGLENGWMIDYESFLTERPSRFFIEVLEDTNLLVISYSKLHRLMNTVPAFAKMMDVNNYHHVIASQRRIHAAIGLSAEERFMELQQSNPEFLHRFPQTLIASYLGITAQTLSKVRRRVLLR
jgi:CRP-like cAMP-binding protein